VDQLQATILQSQGNRDHRIKDVSLALSSLKPKYEFSNLPLRQSQLASFC
jgi:hypothetical protein